MKVQIGTGSASGEDVFKLVWRGWFFGVLVIFFPILALAALASLAGGSRNVGMEPILAVLLVPVIAAMQGVMAGGLVLLGLKVRPPKEDT